MRNIHLLCKIQLKYRHSKVDNIQIYLKKCSVFYFERVRENVSLWPLMINVTQFHVSWKPHEKLLTIQDMLWSW
jgi:hypothetical protein